MVDFIIEIVENGYVKFSFNLFVGGILDNGLGLVLLYFGVNGEGFCDKNDDFDINDICLKVVYVIDEYVKIEVNLYCYDVDVDMFGGLIFV